MAGWQLRGIGMESSKARRASWYKDCVGSCLFLSFSFAAFPPCVVDMDVGRRSISIEVDGKDRTRTQ